MSGIFSGIRSSRVSNADLFRTEHTEAKSLLGGGSQNGKKRKAKREDYSDDEDRENLAIPLNRTSTANPDQCVEAEVQPGDTLQSLSLKYNVPLAELKRVNNLHRDTELYALKRVKIPVQYASLLTEILPEVSADRPNESGWRIQQHLSPASTTVQSSTPVSESETDCLTDSNVPVSHRLVDLGGPPSPTENQPKSKEVKKANKFLKSIDKDITRVKNNLGPVEGEGEDEEEGYTLTTHNGEGLPVTTRLTMPVRRHPYDAGWCSKQGLTCALVIILCVLGILALAYWLNLHETWFERKVEPHHDAHHEIRHGAHHSSTTNHNRTNN